MIERSFFRRITGFTVLALVSALAGLSLLWACRLSNTDSQDHFDLKVDSAWTKCDSLLVVLQDDKGNAVDTLFNDSVAYLSRLANLSADKYTGGKAKVHIVGRKAGGLCLDQTRSFDDQGGPVHIDTAALAGARPKSLEINPFTLEISVGDPDAEILASIKPAFADQVFEWSVEDASIATLDFPHGANAGRVLVVPQKNGTVILRARAKQDTSLVAELVVKVGSVSGKSISLAPDTLKMFLGGPDSALTAHIAPESTGTDIVWTSGDAKIAKVDSKGAVSAVDTGTTFIKAKFGDAAATSIVQVKRDVPVLTVASKTGAAVNVPIVFSPKATQEFGAIVMFKWDLQGDGIWDDSLPGPFLGNSVDLPPQTAKYAKQGTVTAMFLVRDGEGNEATVGVHLDIGDQPPEVLSISRDTTITIKDSVPLRAKVHDREGKVAWIGWDFESDGKFDDTLKTDDSIVTFQSGHVYNKAGEYSARLRAVDDNGKVRIDSVHIKVLLDPPVADAGKDTSIFAGTLVNIHAGGKDSLGSIAKRELKVGAGPYLNLSKQDTSFKLAQDSGSVTCVVRVTDDDGNSDEDTMIVTILTPDRSNKQLAGLVPSAGALSPVFKPASLNYAVIAAYADSLISLTITTVDPAATFAVNGKPVANGAPSDPQAVNVGTNTEIFKITVTAEDGSQLDYKVSVIRAPSTDASLSKLEPTGFTLKPAFASGILDYADTVAFAVNSVSIKPTASHPAAKITINDSIAVVSGTSSKSLALDMGDNLGRVAVTAQDGKTKSVYNVKVVRRTKLILNRIAGSGATVRTDSSEYPPGITASIQSPDTVGFHFVKWVVTSGTATLADSSANPADLTLKSGPVRVLAVWAVNKYAITTNVSGFSGGIFSPVTTVVQHGKDTTVTITPLVGYRVLSLTDNGAVVPTLGGANGFGPRTYILVNVTDKHKLEATFLKTYTITTSVTGSGTLTPLGAMEVDSGTTQKYTMTSLSPGTGVWVSAFTDNGVDSTGAVTDDKMNTSHYALTNINANHTLAATFAIRTFRLTVIGKGVTAIKSGQILFCGKLFFCPPVDSLTITVNYGDAYVIHTDSLNASGTAFNSWSGGPPTATGNPATVSLTTGDARYAASYCVSRLCSIIFFPPVEPPILINPVLSQPLQSTPAALGVSPVPGGSSPGN